VVVGPEETVDGEYDHDYIGDGVPEFGDVPGDFVVGLAPVDCRRLFAPEAFIFYK